MSDYIRDGDFETFWNAYPRRTGDIRQAAFEYIGALKTGVTPEQLLEAAKAYAASTEPRYAMSADKWLRNRGWTAYTANPEEDPELVYDVRPALRELIRADDRGALGPGPKLRELFASQHNN